VKGEKLSKKALRLIRPEGVKKEAWKKWSNKKYITGKAE
jgi:hypothetical protein